MMKKMFTLAMMMAMTISANAMSYTAARNEALFLSDKMAHELNLTNAQFDDVYEINLDFLMGINAHHDLLGSQWDRRNADLKYVLTAWQYEKYMGKSYFYRPLTWENGSWSFLIYNHYDRNKYYKHQPTVFVTYKGGNSHKPHHYADKKVAQPTPKPGPKAFDKHDKKHEPAPKPDNGKKPGHDKKPGNGKPGIGRR